MNVNAFQNPKYLTGSTIITGLIIVMIMGSFFVGAQPKKNKLASQMAQADSLLAENNFKGALDLYNQIIKKSRLKKDDDYRVLYGRAFAYYGLNQFDLALNDINTYLGKFPEHQGKLLRAYIYQELSRNEDLLNDLNQLINELPDQPDLLGWRISVLMELEQYTQAQEEIRTLLQKQDDPRLRLYLGLTHYYLGDLDSAVSIFDDLIAVNPDLIETYLYAGSVLIESGYNELALDYFNTGLQQDPQNVTLLYYKGAILVEAEKLTEGCSCLSKAFYNGFDDAGDYLKEYCFGIEGK